MGAGDLIQSFVINPNRVLQGGVGGDSRLILISKNDIASYQTSGVDYITAITLAANKSAFSFDGIRQSMKPKFERVAAESGQSVFAHEVEFVYFDYSQQAKNNCARIAQGRYVGIYENAKQDTNTFEVLGIEVGMECIEMIRTPQELGGAIKIKLRSPEKEYEAKPPASYDTSAGGGTYATNKTSIEGLLFLPTITAGGLSIVTYVAATPTAIVITGTNFFGGGVNNGVLKVELINNATGAVIPFTAAMTVTSTTITTTTPVAVAANSYKVKVTTIKGDFTSPQNITTT